MCVGWGVGLLSIFPPTKEVEVEKKLLHISGPVGLIVYFFKHWRGAMTSLPFFWATCERGRGRKKIAAHKWSRGVNCLFFLTLEGSDDIASFLLGRLVRQP